MEEYISDKLCHFVGRSLPSPDEKFNLLLKITSDGRLLIDPSNPDATSSIESTGAHKFESNGEIWEKISTVCFCDIPNNKLEIHVSKYSRFGIGFTKKFLISKGARPVHYLPVTGVIQHISKTSKNDLNPDQYFRVLDSYSLVFMPIIGAFLNDEKFVNQLSTVFVKEFLNLLEPYSPSLISKLRNRQSLFSDYIEMLMGFRQELAYLKFFDPELGPDDPMNFYYEREWRSLASISFSLSDVSTIYIPSEEYQREFLHRFPSYEGSFYTL
jgi:hypothetical protein